VEQLRQEIRPRGRRRCRLCPHLSVWYVVDQSVCVLRFIMCLCSSTHDTDY
jgi:hypothetical protein